MPAVVASIAWLKTRRPIWNDKVQAVRALAQVLADSPLLAAVAEIRELMAGRGGPTPLPVVRLTRGPDQTNIIEGTAQPAPQPAQRDRVTPAQEDQDTAQ
jgi:hypothetical protein